MCCGPGHPLAGTEHQGRAKLNALIELRTEVVQELQTPDLPPTTRAELIQELQQLGQAIAAARRELQQCQAADMPKPGF